MKKRFLILISALSAVSAIGGPSVRILDIDGMPATKEIKSVQMRRDPLFGDYLELRAYDYPYSLRIRFKDRPADQDMLVNLVQTHAGNLVITAPLGQPIRPSDSEAAPLESEYWAEIKNEKGSTGVPLARELETLRIQKQLTSVAPDQNRVIQTIVSELRQRNAIAAVRSVRATDEGDARTFIGLDEKNAPVFRQVELRAPAKASSLDSVSKN